MFGFFKQQPQVTSSGGHKHRRDLLEIQVIKLSDFPEEEGEVMAKGEGSYLEFIKYEGDEQPFWTINDAIPRMEWVQVEDYLMLPSDSSVRPDAHHILAQEWEEAEASKHELEEL